MRILFDHSTPRKLRKHLLPHLVTTAAQMGWSRLDNGFLLQAGEKTAFDVFVTSDQNITYQQNNKDRKIAIVALTSNHWPDVARVWPEIRAAVEEAVVASYVEIIIPRAGRAKV